MNAMNLVANRCTKTKEWVENLEGIEEEHQNPPQEEMALVLWDMLSSMNMVKDKKEEKDVQYQKSYNLISKGPPNPHVPPLSQNSKNILTTTKNFAPNKSNGKIQINNQRSSTMEYDIMEDLKKVKDNIPITKLCKIAYQWKILQDALNKLKNVEISQKYASSMLTTNQITHINAYLTRQ